MARVFGRAAAEDETVPQRSGQTYQRNLGGS
jgi:hypothetical protein